MDHTALEALNTRNRQSSTQTMIDAHSWIGAAVSPIMILCIGESQLSEMVLMWATVGGNDLHHNDNFERFYPFGTIQLARDIFKFHEQICVCWVNALTLMAVKRCGSVR